jgi:hypothetical protein
MLVMHNPYFPQSAQQLRYLGLGNCDDGKSGSTALMGENLGTINGWIATDRCTDVEVDGTTVEVIPEVWISTYVSALRHTEHLSNSGCGAPACETLPCEQHPRSLTP